MKKNRTTKIYKTFDKVKNTIKKLKDNKSVGEDNIQEEIIKYGRKIFAKKTKLTNTKEH